MLTSVTPVQIDEAGSNINAGSLQAGDWVYDGLASDHRQIADVVAMTIDTRDSPDSTPVTIRSNVFGTNIPQTDICVSRDQSLLLVKRPVKSLPFLEQIDAQSLDTSCVMQRPAVDRQVTFIALIFDEPCFLVCAGLLVFGYTLEGNLPFFSSKHWEMVR